MLIILALGGTAIAAVVALNRLRDRDPDAATEAVRNVRQLVAVVVVLARATSAVLDALQSVRVQPVRGVRSFGYPEEDRYPGVDWEEAD